MKSHASYSSVSSSCGSSPYFTKLLAPAILQQCTDSSFFVWPDLSSGFDYILNLFEIYPHTLVYMIPTLPRFQPVCWCVLDLTTSSQFAISVPTALPHFLRMNAVLPFGFTLSDPQYLKIKVPNCFILPQHYWCQIYIFITVFRSVFHRLTTYFVFLCFCRSTPCISSIKVSQTYIRVYSASKLGYDVQMQNPDNNRNTSVHTNIKFVM